MRTRPAHIAQLSLLVALCVSLSFHGATLAVTQRSCQPLQQGAGVGAGAFAPGPIEADLVVDAVGPEEPPAQQEPAALSEPEAPEPVPPQPKVATPAPTKPAPARLPLPPPEPDGETPGAAEAAPPPLPSPARSPMASASGGPNSLQAQGARLGGGTACEDAVAGVWKSSIYDVLRGQWYAFTLTVHRRGDLLSGTIHSKFWIGSARSARVPTSCAETKLFAVVSMPAMGRVEDGMVRFGARSWKLDNLYCGDTISYSPDRFTGRIDPEAHQFQSVVTDGANLIDQPMLFRRVACIP